MSYSNKNCSWIQLQSLMGKSLKFIISLAWAVWLSELLRLFEASCNIVTAVHFISTRHLTTFRINAVHFIWFFSSVNLIKLFDPFFFLSPQKLNYSKFIFFLFSSNICIYRFLFSQIFSTSISFERKKGDMIFDVTRSIQIKRTNRLFFTK